jgi:DNA-binding NtrC family response regulator
MNSGLTRGLHRKEIKAPKMIGNKKETAQDLGISIKTLYNKLDKYQE